ncbi:MAG: CoA-binding protein [Candidatus Zixiibacteriota bacterium]
MPTHGENSAGWRNPSSDEIKKLLDNSRTIAVVGLSSNPERPSYRVADYLLQKGYKIIPVNPRETEILGLKAYPDLESIPDKIDIVDVFRQPSEAKDIVERAISCGAGAVWLQESVVSLDAFCEGEKAGMIIVMDRCIKKEHSRLSGS